jgi:RNA 2',3'-cyclic 3'-phosphodiesterase
MRLFVAIELDHPMKRTLRRLVEHLQPHNRDVRWVHEDNMHLTLKFLGDVPAEKLDCTIDACRSTIHQSAAFSITLDRCGCFPPAGPVRIIWGGLEDPSSALTALALRCEDEFQRIRVDREDRPFASHVTIGRVRNDRSQGALRRSVESAPVRTTTQSVDHMVLFESSTHPQGVRYTAVERLRFDRRD